ncbi:HipA domain-containing protein [Bifidobacterium aquikefiricola]|uniref:HipA domain-containing protein n=1 Tax=Bifidobacterium aquikefiricola TaxID=3059038 RepID=A0AB39U654_9BIFI
MVIEQRQLLCRDRSVLAFSIDTDSGRAVGNGRVLDSARLPLEFISHGKLSVFASAIDAWWFARAIPGTRDHIRASLESIGLHSAQELLNRSFGLSLSDQFWVRPSDSNVRWQDVNFFTNPFDEDLGKALFSPYSSSAHLNFNSPDATSGGDLPKRWAIDPSSNTRVLIKGGRYNQEPLNEHIASDLCARLGVDHVQYRLAESDNRLVSVCDEMLSDNEELLSAGQVINAFKADNQLSRKSQWIASAAALGAAEEELAKATDDFILVDYLMRNTDRHYGNFGLIRNVESLQLRPAPIYDTGASLWAGQLQMDNRDYISLPFFASQGKPTARRQLRLLSKDSWKGIDMSLLADWPSYVAQELSRYDQLSPSRIATIEHAVAGRVEHIRYERNTALSS